MVNYMASSSRKAFFQKVGEPAKSTNQFRKNALAKANSFVKFSIVIEDY